MPSSSAYAAPLDLDLRSGLMERGARGVILLLALGAVLASDLALSLQAPAAMLAVALALADARRAATRPARLRLHADGHIECASRDEWQPAVLHQATGFCGLIQLQWSFGRGRHAGVVFPDRVDAAARQRLRLWLATHRPQAAAEGLAA